MDYKLKIWIKGSQSLLLLRGDSFTYVQETTFNPRATTRV
jgi:hypothetical protein